MARGDSEKVNKPQLRETAVEPPSPHPDVTTSLLGEDRCDVPHPTIPDVVCVLRVGHGGNHQSAPTGGHTYEWA